MTTIDISKLFADAVLEANGKALPPLAPDSVIAKLGIDSVTIMEVIFVLEEKLGVRFPDEELSRVQTIGDLGGLVDRLLAPNATPSRPGPQAAV